jgi:hypothetical protein
MSDWTALGRRLYLELGRVARERVDLSGDEAYGEALRTAVERRLIPAEEHERAVDDARSAGRFEINQARREGAETAARNATHEADLRRTLAEELRRMADCLPVQRARGMRAAAEYVWPDATGGSSG